MSPNAPIRPRSVVCLSGGMDSCVTAALAVRSTEAYALHFGYGQRTEARELEAARGVAERLGMRYFLHLRIDIFRRIGGSALTDAQISVPDAKPDFGNEPAGENAKGAAIPVTYV